MSIDAFAGDINKSVLTHNILIKCFIRGTSNGLLSRFKNFIREKKFIGDGGHIITKDGKKYATREIFETTLCGKSPKVSDLNVQKICLAKNE